MNSIMLTLLKLSVSGAILSLLLMLAMPLLKRHTSKAFCCYIWIPVLLRIVLPFGVEFHIPAENAQSQIIISDSGKTSHPLLTSNPVPLDGATTKPSAQIPQSVQQQTLQRSPHPFEYLHFI